LPALPVAENSQPRTDHSIIRIHSDRKWPERVVFDTSHPTITPAQPPAAVIAEAPAPPRNAAAEPAKTHVREAFAEMRPSPTEPRSHEPKRRRKAVAKNYYGPPNYHGSPRIIVAQQPPAFFFGNNIW
jgi:hypothetical protein